MIHRSCLTNLFNCNRVQNVGGSPLTYENKTITNRLSLKDPHLQKFFIDYKNRSKCNQKNGRIILARLSIEPQKPSTMIEYSEAVLRLEEERRLLTANIVKGKFYGKNRSLYEKLKKKYVVLPRKLNYPYPTEPPTGKFQLIVGSSYQ